MTREDKMKWLANATPDELLRQYVSLIDSNRYGVNSEDIQITHDEIVRRMMGSMSSDTIYYVVRDGEILFTGTEEECGKIVLKDMTGRLEVYPASARIRN